MTQLVSSLDPISGGLRVLPTAEPSSRMGGMHMS